MNFSSARRAAITLARQKLALHPLYLDTETTGLDSNSEIVEICVIDDDEQALFESLVKPTRGIPRDVIRIHGITDEMVKDAPAWREVWPEVEAILAKRNVAIYNADFDLRMMQQSHARYWMQWNLPMNDVFCLMKLYAQFYGQWNSKYGSYKWQSLEAAGQQCRIPLPNSHRAKDDVRLARAVLHYVSAASV